MGLPIIGAIAEVQNMPAFRAAIAEVNTSLGSIGSTVGSGPSTSILDSLNAMVSQIVGATAAREAEASATATAAASERVFQEAAIAATVAENETVAAVAAQNAAQEEFIAVATLSTSTWEELVAAEEAYTAASLEVDVATAAEADSQLALAAEFAAATEARAVAVTASRELATAELDEAAASALVEVALGAVTIVVAALVVATALAVAGIIAVTAAEASLIANGVSVNASLERTEIQLQALSGLGEENLQWAKDLSIHMPFTPQSVASALQQAYAYGFTGDQAKQLVVATADVSAAFGDQGDRMNRLLMSLGKMSEANKVNARDMRMMTEAGVNAWDILAKAAGVSIATIRKEVTDGTISASWAVTQLTQGMEAKFGGAAQNASNSLLGVIANIHNIIDISSASVSLPLFDKIKEVLVGIRTELESTDFSNLTAQVRDLIAQLSANIDAGAIVRFFTSLVQGAQDAIRTIEVLRDELMGISGAAVLNNAQVTIAGNNMALSQSLNELSAAHDNMINSLNEEIASAAMAEGDTLSAIDKKYAQQAQDLSDKVKKAVTDNVDAVAKAQRDLSQKIADEQDSLQDTLDALAISHAEKLASINKGLADNIYEYELKLADLRNKLNGEITSLEDTATQKRTNLQARMAAAVTKAEKDSLQARINVLDQETEAKAAALTTTEKAQEVTLKTAHDRAVLGFTDQTTIEYAKYQYQVELDKEESKEKIDRYKADNAIAMADLQKRLDQEQSANDKAASRLTESKAAEVASAQKQYAQDVAALQSRISEENSAFEAQRSKQVEATLTENDRVLAEAKKTSDQLISDSKTTVSILVDDISKGDWIGAGKLAAHAVIEGLISVLLTGPELFFVEAASLLLGTNIAQGIAKGLDDQASAITKAIETLVDNAYDAAMKALNAHSASKLFAEAGETIPQGLALGIQQATNQAMQAMQAMLASTGNAASMGITPLAGMMSQISHQVSSPAVNVQGGTTNVDRSINVNANYAQTQSPVQIMQDLQLAAMLQGA
jgi:tape measure domain-containing protein